MRTIITKEGKKFTDGSHSEFKDHKEYIELTKYWTWKKTRIYKRDIVSDVKKSNPLLKLLVLTGLAFMIGVVFF